MTEVNNLALKFVNENLCKKISGDKASIEKGYKNMVKHLDRTLERFRALLAPDVKVEVFVPQFRYVTKPRAKSKDEDYQVVETTIDPLDMVRFVYVGIDKETEKGSVSLALARIQLYEPDHLNALAGPLV